MLDHAAGGAIGRSVPQAAESDMKRDRCQSHRCSRIYTKRIPASPCFLAFQEFCCLTMRRVEQLAVRSHKPLKAT
jgi:hypothetical protein